MMNTPKNAIILLFTFCLFGCKSSQIVTYQVPPEPSEVIQLNQLFAGQENNQKKIQWPSLKNWNVEHFSAPRLGYWVKPISENEKIEFTITQFPGTMGSLLDNINRWQGQIQEAPLTEADLVRVSETVSFAVGSGTWVQLLNGKTGISVVIIPKPNGTWFFKMTGPSLALKEAQSDLIPFVKAIDPHVL